MTRREWFFGLTLAVLMGGLLLGTPSGRAVLTAPMNPGLPVPQWAVWSVGALGYGVSLLLRPRWLRVAAAYGVIHAFIPAFRTGSGKLPGTLVLRIRRTCRGE